MHRLTPLFRFQPWSPSRFTTRVRGIFYVRVEKRNAMGAYKDASNPWVKSRYKAYSPDGEFKEVVVLTNESKRRYEAKGWTFKRATSNDTRVW